MEQWLIRGLFDHEYLHGYSLFIISRSYGGLTSSTRTIGLWYHCDWADIDEVTASYVGHVDRLSEMVLKLTPECLNRRRWVLVTALGNSSGL